jgi:diaminopimelate decarboxylase
MASDYREIISSYHIDLDGPEIAIGGVVVSRITQVTGTPVYIYNEKTIWKQAAELSGVLTSLNMRQWRINYAIKANRSAVVLRSLRRLPYVCIDACSPREVDRALLMGWSPQHISLTASMLANKDLQHIAQLGVHVTLDNLSAIRRYRAFVPEGTSIGLRVDPEASGIGYMSDPLFEYSSSKLGILPSDFPEAVRYATSLGFVVDTIHFHSGWGMQTKDAAAFARILSIVSDLAKEFPCIETVNVGGGLTVPYTRHDAPLPCGVWADLLRTHFAAHPTLKNIACEIGTFLLAPAGCLVCEVNTLNVKGVTTWAGVDAGFPTNLLFYHYAIPLQVFRVREPSHAHTTHVNIASNINEAKDGFGNSVSLPPLVEGDLLLLFPVGAYGSAMASDHCMRGDFAEAIVLADGSVEIEEVSGRS